MTAIACLRVAVGRELRFTDDENMAVLVARIAGSFLESTWKWPRRFGLVAPFAFVLADPRVERLDAVELQALARDLQKKLFGDAGGGDVCLLMIEGSQAEVMRFASANLRNLEPLLNGVDDGAFQGRICRITPTTVESLAPPNGPVDGKPPADVLRAADRARLKKTGWWGIYYLPNETFVGAALAVRPEHAGLRGDQVSDLDYDIICIHAARDAIAAGEQGVIFLPFNFSSVIRRSARAALKAELDTLPLDQRFRLAASIREVPREPTHSALMHIRSLLRPHVAFLDLRVSDPLFRIESMPTGLATSVTLSLAGSDDRMRLAAIKAFFAERDFYQARRVWQGVSDLSSPTELDYCRIQNAPFVSGPMISSLLRGPLKDVLWAPDALPYREPAAVEVV